MQVDEKNVSTEHFLPQSHQNKLNSDNFDQRREILQYFERSQQFLSAYLIFLSEINC